MLIILKNNSRVYSLLSLILSFVVFFQFNSLAQTRFELPDAPKEYEIGGIRISGVQYLDKDILRTYTGLSIGQKISVPGEDIGKAINALWRQGLFANISVSAEQIVGNTIFLDFNLTERPRLANYSFVGIGKTDAEDLNKKVNLVKMKVLTDNLKTNAVQQIVDYYIEKGNTEVKVTIKETKDTTLKNAVDVLFVVDKGRKIKIEEVIVEGNVAFTGARIEHLLKETKEHFRIRPLTHSDFEYIQNHSIAQMIHSAYALTFPELLEDLSNRFRVKLSGSKYNRDMFELDKEKVVEFYNEKGYRDAAVVWDSVYKGPNGNYIVRLRVDEGHKYYFRNIYWKGNTKYSDKFLAAVLNIHSGDVYNKAVLDARLNMNPNSTDVSSLYMDDGYLFFQVTPSEVYVNRDSIDMEIRIYEGPQATINKIVIKGNDKTNEHVIRRELRTIPGQKFSRNDIMRSQREIAALGYFNAEKIGITPIPHPENGTVDIEYAVEEKSSDQIELQAGWGGKVTGLIGTVGVNFNNFSVKNMLKPNAWGPLPSGDGQKLGLRLQSNGKYYQAATFSFTEPWLGGKKPVSLSIALYKTAMNNTYNSTASKFSTTGATVGIGKRLKFPDEFFTLSSNLTFEQYDAINSSPYYSILRNGKSNNFNLEEVLVRSTIGDPLYPRGGSKYSLSVKMTPPYSMLNNMDYGAATMAEKYKWLEYNRWRFTAENYTKVYGNLILKTSAKIGLLGNYSGKTGDSPYERFQVGGDGLSNYSMRGLGIEIISLRGYEVADVFQNKNTGSSTSTIFNKFTMELRYPFTLNPSSTIYGLAFIEGGNANIGIKNYDPFRLKRSAGIGIRVFLPMFGLLGVDYGIGFDKANLTSTKLSNLGKFNIILGFEPE